MTFICQVANVKALSGEVLNTHRFYSSLC